MVKMVVVKKSSIYTRTYVLYLGKIIIENKRKALKVMVINHLEIQLNETDLNNQTGGFINAIFIFLSLSFLTYKKYSKRINRLFILRNCKHASSCCTNSKRYT